MAVIWLTGAVILCIALQARAIEYTFEKAFEATAGQFNQIYGPSLNDSGAMAFTAFLPDGSYRAYGLTSAGVLKPISSVAGGSVGNLFTPINNSNTIAYQQGPFIYRNFSFEENVLYQQTDLLPGGIQGLQDPWLGGDSDTVVYRASLRPPPDPFGESAIFRGNGMNPKVVGGPPTTTTFQWPHISSSEDVVVVGSGGVYLNSTIVYQHSGSSATINDSGTIAFFTGAYGPLGIYTGDGASTPALYATSTGGTGMGHPDINNDGLIAYLDTASGAESVYVGTGHERLLGKNTNSLFGSFVSSMQFFRGLNNHGQIAFAYLLGNGQRGIALASPRDPAVLGNGDFGNGLNLFEVIDDASDGSAFVRNVSGNPRLEMTTENGVLSLRQQMDTSSGDPYELEFDFDWLTIAGSLEVNVNDELVLTVNADGSVASTVGLPAVQSMGDLTRLSLSFMPADISDPPGGYIRFDLNPGSEATIQLDNISFAPPPFTADFDEDGDVDAADLAQWRGDFGATPDSDADDDGDSDGDDFFQWQRQLGSPGAVSFSTASSAAVPEPASVLLMACGAVLMRTALARYRNRLPCSNR